MARANAVWLKPVATDIELMVNREAELTDLVGRLNEFVDCEQHEGHILVTGERGTGKSIFTRKALHLAAQKCKVLVPVTIDARFRDYRSVLKDMAVKVADAISDKVGDKRKDLLLWMDQLRLLAGSSEITRATTLQVARKYGAEGSAQVGSDLLGKLAAKLYWEESYSFTHSDQARLLVTDELLHAALVATCERLTARDAPWYLVVFFDDLDQTSAVDPAQSSAEMFRKVLNLRPCISIVHFRSEVLLDNLRREAGETIQLLPLQAETMVGILQQRLVGAPERVQKQFPPTTDWSAAQWLAARCRGNPLVFLRWVHGALRTQDWPLPGDWNRGQRLEKIVFEAGTFAGVDAELLAKAVRVMDHCDGGRDEVAVQDADLLRGCLGSDSRGAPEKLSAQELEALRKLEVLLPRHHHLAERGLRLAPVADLLRPSRA